ncbi:hypothetical protein NL676_009526 [Syzygium grande]|nr:hypothetical protein NL676_009526 [Syzygium grande]
MPPPRPSRAPRKRKKKKTGASSVYLVCRQIQSRKPGPPPFRPGGQSCSPRGEMTALPPAPGQFAAAGVRRRRGGIPGKRRRGWEET